MWWQYKHCPIGPVQSPVYPSCQHCGLVGSGWITGWLEAVSGLADSKDDPPPPGDLRLVCHPPSASVITDQLQCHTVFLLPSLVRKILPTVFSLVNFSQCFSVQNEDREFSSGSDNEGMSDTLTQSVTVSVSVSSNIFLRTESWEPSLASQQFALVSNCFSPHLPAQIPA